MPVANWSIGHDCGPAPVELLDALDEVVWPAAVDDALVTAAVDVVALPPAPPAPDPPAPSRLEPFAHATASTALVKSRAVRIDTS
jgi:hypothetical protein